MLDRSLLPYLLIPHCIHLSVPKTSYSFHPLFERSTRASTGRLVFLVLAAEVVTALEGHTPLEARRTQATIAPRRREPGWRPCLLRWGGYCDLPKG